MHKGELPQGLWSLWKLTFHVRIKRFEPFFSMRCRSALSFLLCLTAVPH
jgi:hypothetical protein